MRIDIIGAGIGGLTTAIALEQKGISVRIFEQTDEIKPVGAGIILANNAMQVYDKLGLKEVIEQHGNPISTMNMTKKNLDPLSKMDLTYFERKHKTKNIAIHRGTLQQILIDQLKTTKIYLDHKLTLINKNESGYVLRFENGEDIESEIVLGADGIHSMVRQHIFPGTNIRHANQICWRGITSFTLPQHYKSELNEAWGTGERFGFVQIAEHSVYWYALKSFEENKEQWSKNHIEEYYQTYHPLIKDLISSTQTEDIYSAEISDLKPTDQWYKGKVCLIGDAAHATTPNMGQGACQAIEDAYVLSHCLKKFDVKKAFQEFQKLRLPKAHQVVKASWNLGKMAHVKHPILIGLRNGMLKFTPSFVFRRQSEQLFQLNKM